MSTEADLNGYEIQVSDTGLTLWVHAPEGSTVGRFDKRFGIDLHTTVTEQLAGKGQCLFCTHEAPTPEDWELFRAGVMEHYGVEVPADAITFEHSGEAPSKQH